MERIWLSPPHLGMREKEYLAAAVESNWVAPLGPCVDGFEADLQAWTGARAAAALSSGTAAIHLGLALLGVQPGDYVLCQSLTFAATANPIRYLGAVPVFVDSERESWNLCPQALERAIDGCLAGRRDDRGRPLEARRPAALLPVHIYGMPANMAAIGELAQRHRIPILEDAAEALGLFLAAAPGAAHLDGDAGVGEVHREVADLGEDEEADVAGAEAGIQRVPLGLRGVAGDERGVEGLGEEV